MELLFITSADPARPSLTYRLEFEDESVYSIWNGVRWFAENRDEVFQATMGGLDPQVNTMIVNLEDWSSTKYFLSWTQVMQQLDHAVTIPRGIMGPGRPYARVLQSTTSRDRRMYGQAKRAW
jgi:hypothetical protein